MKLYGDHTTINEKMSPKDYKEMFKLMAEQLISAIDNLDEVPVYAEVFINRLGPNDPLVDPNGRRVLSFCWKLTTDNNTTDLFEGSVGVIGKIGGGRLQKPILRKEENQND